MALEDYVSRRCSSGFVAPSYTFGTETTDDGRTLSELRESTGGRDELLRRLGARVPRYHERGFKFWCYDTPGVVNPNQVGRLS